MNRRMPNGTYGGVRGWGREAPAYSIIFLTVIAYDDFVINYYARCGLLPICIKI